MCLSHFENMAQEVADDGCSPQLIELKNARGMHLVLMDIGATWLSCQLPLANGELREVLLGVDSLADFQRQISYLGATVGRYANRIAQARFAIDGTVYTLNANQQGHCLHGGVGGFHACRWTVVNQTDNTVQFSLHSPDGDQGFPGHLQVSVTYTLTDDHQVTIDYTATTNQPTPVNMTNHAYFNLQGANQDHSCLHHHLWLDAASYLPVDDCGIPLGSLASVAETGFDFRQLKFLEQDLMRDQQQRALKGYDHAYLLAKDRDPQQPVAQLVSPDHLVQLWVTTTMPAIQLYTGNWLGGTPGRAGKAHFDYAGVALETQFLPDSPNHPEWAQPSCILVPGQLYTHQTAYRFEC